MTIVQHYSTFIQNSNRLSKLAKKQ